MIKNIKYYKDFDSLYFELQNICECHIDKDGDLEFSIESFSGEDISIFISIEQMKEIINMYENRNY